MKLPIYLTLPVLAVVVFSCNCNDDDAVPFLTPATEYLPLNKGNYWVYEWYKLDTLGNATLYDNFIDSIYISGDTIINGNTYAIMEGTEFNSKIRYFYRDSSGYLVDAEHNTPLFNTNSTNELLGIDTVFSVPNYTVTKEVNMQAPMPSITVPAGTFTNCLSTISTVITTEENYPYGNLTFPYHYAKGIGRLSHRIAFYGSGLYYESRLVRYHIE